MPGGWNKGLVQVDWNERVRQKFGERFILVSVGETDAKGQRHITVECLNCGAIKEVSSISFRGRTAHRGFCEKCRAGFERSETYLEKKRRLGIQTKTEKDMKRLQAKLRTEKKRNKKKLKENQMVFNLCSCGAFISPGRKVCDDCKRKTLRATESRKETKRRIKTEGEFDKTITLEKLFTRDNGICYLCQKACDWKDYQIINGAFVVGKSYPTIEHVLAICNGGTHTWNNVKLACHACNSKKGKKLLAG